MTQKFDLLIHPDLEEQLEGLHTAWEQDPESIEGREYVAAMEALDALEEGREADYKGKQLSFGRDSTTCGTAPRSRSPSFAGSRSTAGRRTTRRTG